MKQYKIIYQDSSEKVIDSTLENIVQSIEVLKGFGALKIYELDDEKTFDKLIWTIEDGLLVRYGEELESIDYFKDGSELFNADYSNILLSIESLLTDLDISDEKEKAFYDRLEQIKEEPETLEAIKNLSIVAVCNNISISKYILKYKMSEIENMKEVWDEFGSIVQDTICKYFDMN